MMRSSFLFTGAVLLTHKPAAWYPYHWMKTLLGSFLWFYWCSGITPVSCERGRVCWKWCVIFFTNPDVISSFSVALPRAGCSEHWRYAVTPAPAEALILWVMIKWKSGVWFLFCSGSSHCLQGPRKKIKMFGFEVWLLNEIAVTS